MSLDIMSGLEVCVAHRWKAPVDYATLPCPICTVIPFVEVALPPEPASYYVDSNEIPDMSLKTVTFRKRWGRPNFGEGTFTTVTPVWCLDKE